MKLFYVCELNIFLISSNFLGDSLWIISLHLHNLRVGSDEKLWDYREY